MGWAAMALGSTLLLFYEVGFHLLLRFSVFICELSFTLGLCACFNYQSMSNLSDFQQDFW